MKIRCYRAKPTRKQVRLYCKFVLYCELLSNLCIRVKIYSQKQLVSQHLINHQDIEYIKDDFNELMNIKGDKGGRDLLSNFLDKSVEVDLGEAVAFDIDTNGSYELVKSNLET